MSEQEHNLIKQIVANRPQFEALQSFLLTPLEPQNLNLSTDLSNEEYGEKAKVAAKATGALVEQFVAMERLIEKPEERKQINEAR